jgi:hypothetical protein
MFLPTILYIFFYTALLTQDISYKPVGDVFSTTHSSGKQTQTH